MKKAIALSNCFFQLYSPYGEWYLLRKCEGEYNITVSFIWYISFRWWIMSDSILRCKSKDFAKKIVFLCRDTKTKTKESVLTNQLLRSGTSIGGKCLWGPVRPRQKGFYLKAGNSTKGMFWNRILAWSSFWNRLYRGINIQTFAKPMRCNQKNVNFLA